MTEAPTQEKIIEVLREAGTPLPPKEIANRGDLSYNSVRKIVRRMKDAGDLVQPRTGRYDLPENAEAGEGAGLPYKPKNGFQLTIYHSVRPAAGAGNVIYEVDENEAETHPQSKKIFHDLLGFWPPDDLRGVYIDGESMKPGLEDGQLVLYRPVQELTSGKRYILLVEDPVSGDWKLRLKRIQVFTGGGLKLISDNRGLGIEDEVLLPNGGDGLVHKETGQKVQLRIVGQVLWPREEDEAKQVRLITRTIEQLAGQGLLRQN